MTTPYMRIKVSREGIDGYPELLAAYKRTLGQALTDRFGVEPNWDTYRRFDYIDDPLSREEDYPFSVLTVDGKEEE